MAGMSHRPEAGDMNTTGCIAGQTKGNGRPRRASTFRVLVGNDPAFYRDTMSTVVQTLRPHVEVTEVEPTDLDNEVLRLRPHFVVCSELTEVVASLSFAWVLVYPAGANVAVISIGGRQRTIPSVVFDDVLAAIDRAVAMAGAS